VGCSQGGSNPRPEL